MYRFNFQPVFDNLDMLAHGAWLTVQLSFAAMAIGLVVSVLGAVANRLPGAFGYDVAFKKPLFLPSTVTLATAQADGGWDVAVRNATSGTEHVVGTIRPL